MSGKKKITVDAQILFFQKRDDDNLKFGFKIGGVLFQVFQFSEDDVDLRIETRRFFDIMKDEKTGRLKKLKEEYNKKLEEEKKKKEIKEIKKKKMMYHMKKMNIIGGLWL